MGSIMATDVVDASGMAKANIQRLVHSGVVWDAFSGQGGHECHRIDTHAAMLDISTAWSCHCG